MNYTNEYEASWITSDFYKYTSLLKYDSNRFDHSGVIILLFPFSNVSKIENAAIKTWFDSFHNKVVVVVVEKASELLFPTLHVTDTFQKEQNNDLEQRFPTFFLFACPQAEKKIVYP